MVEAPAEGLREPGAVTSKGRSWMSLGQRENRLSLCPFVLLGPAADRTLPTHPGQGHLLQSVHHLTCLSPSYPLAHTFRMMVHQPSGHHSAQAGC